MPSTPAAAVGARPAPVHHGDAAPHPSLPGIGTVPLAALAVSDQITVCTLDQWLQAFHRGLVPLPADPPALQHVVRAAVVQAQWHTLFQTVQQLGTSSGAVPAPLLEAVLHVVRGDFTTLALAMELLIADGGDGDDGDALVALVQAQRRTLHGLIPDLAGPHAVGARVYGRQDAITP